MSSEVRKRAVPTIRALLPAAGAVARRPSLWATALRQVRVMAPSRWWARPPFLPVPDRAYFGFRLETAYGDPGCAPDPQDIVTYLHWCRAWPHLAG